MRVGRRTVCGHFGSRSSYDAPPFPTLIPPNVVGEGGNSPFLLVLQGFCSQIGSGAVPYHYHFHTTLQYNFNSLTILTTPRQARSSNSSFGAAADANAAACLPDAGALHDCQCMRICLLTCLVLPGSGTSYDCQCVVKQVLYEFEFTRWTYFMLNSCMPV